MVQNSSSKLSSFLRITSPSCTDSNFSGSEITAPMLEEFEDAIKKDAKIKLATNAFTRLDTLQLL